MTGVSVVSRRFWAWAARHPGWGFTVFLLGTIVVVLVSVLARSRNPVGPAITIWSYILTVVEALLILFLVGLALHSSSGKLSDLIIGTDRRASTSKMQYLLWTVGVSFALCLIAMRTFLDPHGSFVCEKMSKLDCVPNDGTWEQYLILLGVPAAAAVIAKATVTYKSENGILQKTSAAKASVADIANNDNGQADLADVQYLVFNVIAFVYFAANFLNKGTFVPVPNILLGLTSAAAATYTLNKAMTSNRPIIKSIQPGRIANGTQVTLQGANLFPDASNARVVLKIGGRVVEGVVPVNPTASSASVDTAVFRAPAGMSTDNPLVTVVTADGTETAGYPVAIVVGTVLGWAGARPGPAESGRLRVAGLGPDGRVEVNIGSDVAPATMDQSTGTITFTVPEGVTAGSDVDLTVLVDGVQAASGTVTLKPVAVQALTA